MGQCPPRLRLDKYSIASIGITFIASALTVHEAVKRHLKDLQDTAAAIERDLVANDVHLAKES